MGIVKCSNPDCGSYMHDDEVVWVQLDDTHDVPYCVSCAPDQSETFSEEYD